MFSLSVVNGRQLLDGVLEGVLAGVLDGVLARCSTRKPFPLSEVPL